MGFESDRLVRVVLRATNGSDQQVNTLHYDLDQTEFPGENHANDPQSLADIFRDDVIPKFKALYTSSWVVEPVLIVEEFDPLNPTAGRESWSSGTSGPGTKLGVSNLTPRAVCAVAVIHTKFVGKRHTGRMFLGGSWSESDMAGDTFEMGGLTIYQQFLDAIPRQPDISGPLVTATADWCVYSRTQRAGDNDPYAADVSSVTLKNKIHWLRSREV